MGKAAPLVLTFVESGVWRTLCRYITVRTVRDKAALKHNMRVIARSPPGEGRRSNLRGAVWGKLRNCFAAPSLYSLKVRALAPNEIGTLSRMTQYRGSKITHNKPLEAQLGLPYVHRALQKIDGIHP